MTRNNLCNSIIVYGSWAPGGVNHHLVNGLPGEWRKGQILTNSGSSGDNLFPGEHKSIEAWILKFSDYNAEMFSPEWEKQQLSLFERWEELDRKMGAKMSRSQTSWWPELDETVRGQHGQQVVNIYLPMKNYPYLKDVLDSPHPSDENDVGKLWKQQLRGDKKYDSSVYIGLIKDATLEECIAYFVQLPKITPFLQRLMRFYTDMASDSGYLLRQDGDAFHLYALPKTEHQITATEAEKLVKKDIEQKTVILERKGDKFEGKLLRSVNYKVEKIPNEEQDFEGASGVLIEFNEWIEDSIELNHHWEYCLSEACYGIGANYVISQYLMAHLYPINFDFNLPYQLWKGGWEYGIYEKTCFISKLQ
ncbi:MAG: hypothetical protein GQ574_16225 [Crocinitomix sp.]|nr:hypothetical protein [Crocinitomix sp.]